MPLDAHPRQGPDHRAGPLLRQEGFGAGGDRGHRRLFLGSGPDEAAPEGPAGQGIRVHLQPDRVTSQATIPRYTGEPPPRFNLAGYCLGRIAMATPGKTALLVIADADASLEAAEHWTYGALDEAARRVASGLLALGLAPGERLMIRLPNTSDYALLFFGAIAAGIVPLPVSPQLTAAEADFLLADSGAAAVV